MKEGTCILSIVTPSYNHDEFIEETIQTILSQEGDFYIDYIIMDGGSTDSTVEILKKYQRLLENNCTRQEMNGLTYYIKRNDDFRWNRCSGISFRWQSEKDKGPTHAINKGFRIARGHIFGTLLSDDLYYPDVFKKLAQLDWRDIDFVYGKGMWCSVYGQDLMRYPTFKPTIYNLYYQCVLCMPTVFFKREAYDDVGEFSLKLNFNFDYEYWLRAAFKSKRFIHVRKLFAKSRMHHENKTLTGRSEVFEEFDRLREIYYIKPRTFFSAVRFLIAKMTVNKVTIRKAKRVLKLLNA